MRAVSETLNQKIGLSDTLDDGLIGEWKGDSTSGLDYTGFSSVVFGSEMQTAGTGPDKSASPGLSGLAC